MLLQDIVGKTKPTRLPPKIHPKELIVGIEGIFKAGDTSKKSGKQGKEFSPSCGTVITSDGLVLLSKHAFDTIPRLPYDKFEVYDVEDNRYSIENVFLDDKTDMAAIQLDNYSRDPFLIEFETPHQDENISTYSLTYSTLIRNGSIYVSTTKFFCDYANNQVNNLATKAPLTKGQSGSLIVNNRGSILGMFVSLPDEVPIYSGKNHMALAHKSSEILKFLRKIYRQMK